MYDRAGLREALPGPTMNTVLLDYPQSGQSSIFIRMQYFPPCRGQTIFSELRGDAPSSNEKLLFAVSGSVVAGRTRSRLGVPRLDCLLISLITDQGLGELEPLEIAHPRPKRINRKGPTLLDIAIYLRAQSLLDMLITGQTCVRNQHSPHF